MSKKISKAMLKSLEVEFTTSHSSIEELDLNQRMSCIVMKFYGVFLMSWTTVTYWQASWATITPILKIPTALLAS